MVIWNYLIQYIEKIMSLSISTFDENAKPRYEAMKAGKVQSFKRWKETVSLRRHLGKPKSKTKILLGANNESLDKVPKSDKPI